MRPILTLSLVLAVIFPATLSAQSVAGMWDATYSTPGGPRSFKIVFASDGEKLTGTIRREAGDSPLAATMKGSAVTFSYTILYNENPITLTVAAKVDGETMKGTVDFGGGATEEFSAKRAPPQAGARP